MMQGKNSTRENKTQYLKEKRENTVIMNSYNEGKNNMWKNKTLCNVYKDMREEQLCHKALRIWNAIMSWGEEQHLMKQKALKMCGNKWTKTKQKKPLCPV